MMAGEFAGVNPEIWQIIDANIEQADRNWSRLATSP